MVFSSISMDSLFQLLPLCIVFRSFKGSVYVGLVFIVVFDPDALSFGWSISSISV